MAAFIVHPNPSDDRARLLSNLMAQLGRQTVFVDTLEAVAASPSLAGSQSLVLVPDALSDGGLAEQALRFAEAQRRHVFLIYISDNITADHYKALVRSEGGEWVRWSALATELLEVIRRVQGRGLPSPETAKVISLMGASGGVGNTSLALETATHLVSATKKKRRVCLLDLNFQYSLVSEYLDVEPRLAIGEIADRPERIDQQIIDIFTSSHSSGLDVFASPPSHLDYATIDEKVIFALLDFIARRYDIVVVDMPTFWLPWSGNLTLGSDVTVVTGSYNVPSVKLTASRLVQLDELGVAQERVAVAMNQCTTSLFGGIVRQSDVEAALAGRRVFYVHRDNRLASEAVNTGRPMMRVSAKSRASKDIRKLAAWLDSIISGQSASVPQQSVAVGG